MTNQSKRGRAAGWGLVAAVLTVLVLAVAVPGWSGGPEGEERVSSSDAAPATGAGASQSQAALETGPQQSEAPPAPVDSVPMPPCWADLARLDRTLSMEDFRGVLASAVSSRDRFLLTYLEERLTRLVGADAQKGLQVLSWVEAAAGEGLEVMVYMEALKKSAAVHHPKVSERLFQLAENAEGSQAVRAAAVIGLETQKRLDAPALKRMKAIALDVRDGQVAWNATRTLGRVMETDFQQTGTFKPYLEGLIDISRKSEDRGVRTLALEMPTYANVVLDEKSVDTLAETVRTDQDPEVREMAALRMSVSEAPDKALEAYSQAFQTENEFCMRWALFRFALRAAGAAALPLAQRFAQQEPLLQQDYLDFKEFYGRGMHDWDQIWLEKTQRLYPQHIACMDSHPADEGQPQ